MTDLATLAERLRERAVAAKPAPLDDVFQQLRELAQRQYLGDEIGALKFHIALLETRIREMSYSAEKAREMIQQTNVKETAMNGNRGEGE